MIPVSNPVYGPFWKLMPKGEKYQSFKAKGGDTCLCKGGDIIKGRGEYQSLYLYRQGENTKVGGEDWEKNMFISFDYSC